MKNPVSRRDFLQASVLGGAGAALVWPALAGGTGPASGTAAGAGPASGAAGGTGLASGAPAAAGVCVTLCSHWSYIGIGWQLGIESCVLSATDAMEMADRPPHVKTCLNMDARAYEFMAEKFPEVAARLKKCLAEGKVELIAGTYGQPMGTTISGESNIRQIVVGRETIRRALGYEMVTFLEEEEFSHPQLPQILAGAGYRFASLAQVDTWGRAGIPILEFNAIRWRGVDGTEIPAIPKNSLFGYSPDLEELTTQPAFARLQALGKPLIFTWEEFGWESPETPDYLTAPAKYQALARKSPVEFVTCGQYLDKYGAHPKESIYLPMEAWNKSLTWGIGGDQLRIMDRKVEAVLLAAETFAAVAYALHVGAPSDCFPLEKAWEHKLASQSHDVGLCEYTRWQGLRMAPLDRVEDRHNFTWGAIGFDHLDAAQQQGREMLDQVMDRIAESINSKTSRPASHVVTVFNPCGHERDDLVLTGRIHSVRPYGWIRINGLPPAIAAPSEADSFPAIPAGAVGVDVRDRDGNLVPSQIVSAERDAQGNLQAAEVAFVARKVPAVGYDTYYLDFVPAAHRSPKSPLTVDQSALTLENEHLRVRLDPACGAVSSLLDKSTGREMLDGTKAPFPTFSGKPNPHLSLRPQTPAGYDSRTSRAKIDWLEIGPVRATVRAYHDAQPQWRHLRFETRVTLTAGCPYVEVTSRILAKVPPQNDVHPADIKEGYWLSLAPSFQPTEIVRDYPLGVEPTKKREFHALTFVDLVGRDMGLLVLHSGTQWFRMNEHGVLQNLVMREWESHFTQEYGWPIYAEYRHAIRPHAGNLTNAQRLESASDFCRPLLAHIGPPASGDLPPTKGFVTIAPAAVQLSALRTKPGGGTEIRVVEVEGARSPVSLDLGFPISGACETNLLGAKVADVARETGGLRFAVDPWKIRTFEVK